MDKGNLAIIPARGGSRRLPGKNIKRLNGIPLIVYTIRAALKSRNISRVIVSTDDQAIADIARRHGSEVMIRPAYLCQDNSLTDDAIFYCLNELKTNEGYIPDKLILLQPTSPFRTFRHIDKAFSILKQKRCDAVISVFEPCFHPLKSLILTKGGFLEALVSGKYCFSPRQKLPKAYMPNGAIYLIKTRAFINSGSLLTSKTSPYIMPVLESVDIDSKDDFEYASYLISRKKWGNNYARF
ncbi:MAG: acylneuraminate cytidylyltransferase family protein [Candidatus Omnitrophica bacterium]|nr:acylneuraminate cytidylyltransferase family protein [Candidatus Omnitrophota bacterium]